jgi:hypothetical protein
MFWILWLSLTLIFISSIIGIYAWNGILLEVVKIKTAKKLWVVSAVAVIIGLLLFIWSVGTIAGTPALVDKFSTLSQNYPPLWIWTAMFFLLLSGFIIGVPTQLYQLKFAKLSLDLRRNLFRVGMLLLALSIIILIWLLMPGNQLPS